MTEPQTLHSYAGFGKSHILATNITAVYLWYKSLNYFLKILIYFFSEIKQKGGDLEFVRKN